MNYVEIDCKLNTKELETQIEQTKQKLEDLLAKVRIYGENSREAKKLTNAIEETNNELERLKKLQSDINNEGFREVAESVKNIEKDFSSVKSGLKSIGQSLSNTITRVARWGLALIGIRSIYSGIRRAISLVSAENENISNQINVMRSAIANALVPLVQTILNMAVKLMIYINYIFKALTGRTLFDFDKAWQNANKNSGATAKNVANIKKQLAGFDEMNVLTDTSTSAGGGAGGAGNVQLTNPFEGWDKIEIPKWVKDLTGWIDKIKEYWLDFVGEFLLIKFLIDVLTGNVFGAIIDVIAFLITQGPKLWEAIKVILKGIWEYLKNVWFPTLIAEIELKLSLISGIIFTAVNLFINPFITLKDTVVGVFNGIKTVVKGVFDVIKGIFTGDMKTVMNGFKQIFKGVFDSLWSIAKTPLNLIIGGINSLIRGANRIKIQVPSWVPGIGGKSWGGGKIPEIPRLAKGAIASYPGRGIPTLGGGASWAEHGAEAYLPLTDSQVMSTLGYEIGKNINLTATVPVYVGNRQIAKEIKKINAESDFAYNR